MWSQCVLEKITIPNTAEWKLQNAGYLKDSSLATEKWQLSNENWQQQTQSLCIYSVEKNKQQCSMNSEQFYDLLQNELNDNPRDHKDTFLTVPFGRKDRYKNIRYFFTPFQNRYKNEKRNWKSLHWFTNGKTSYHELVIACNEKDFTQSFIDHWMACFSKAIMKEPLTAELPETVFRFQTSFSSEMDSSTLEDLRHTIKSRLRDIYSRKIEDNQILYNDKQVLITLFGRIDTAVISLALRQHAVAADLQMHEVDSSISSINYQIDQIQNKENITPVIFTKRANSPAAIGAIQVKDSLLAIDLLKSIHLPVNCMLALEDKGTSWINDWLDIYLLKREPIISGTEIVYCAAQPDFRGFLNLLIKLNKRGKTNLADFTKNNIGNYLAILIDGKVLSAPKLVGEIPGGQIAISGSFSVATTDQYLKKIGYPYPIPMYLLSIERK
jgi:hypothetical protein